MNPERFLDEAEARNLDRILELDLDLKTLRLNCGKLCVAPSRAPAPSHRVFQRSRRWLAGRGLGRGSGMLRAVSNRLRRAPGDAAARALRGRLLLTLGMPEQALVELESLRGEDPGLWLRRAEARLALGDFEDALRALNCLVAARPRQAWPLAWRSEARRMRGDFEGARADLDLALSLSAREPGLLVLSSRLGRPVDLNRALCLEPGFFWALVHRGWTRLRAGRPGPAAEDFSRLLASEPDCGWAWFWLSHACQEAGQFRAAEEARDRAIRLDQSTIWSHLPLGRDKVNLSEWLPALEAAEARLAADPRDAVAYALRADCRDQHEMVVADLRRALALEPRRPWFHGLLARVLVYTGGVAEAGLSMDRAIRLWRDCGWFYAWRGEVRRRQGDLRRAIRDQSRAIGLNGEDPRAWAWRGALKRMTGDLIGAREDLDRSLELDTEYAAWILNERRYVLWSLRDYDGAFEDLHQAARRDLRVGFANAPEGRKDYDWALRTLESWLRRRPGSSWGWAWKGESLLRMGRLARARSALDRALELDSSCDLAHLWRAELDFAEGRLDECRRGVERALARAPRLAWAYALRAELAARAGRLRAAAEDLEIFRRLCVKDCGASLYRARLLRRTGRLGEAAVLCDRIVALNPTDAWAYQERALGRLAAGDAPGAYGDQRLAQRHEARQAWLFGMPGRVLAEIPDRLDYALGELDGMVQDGGSAYWPTAWRGHLQILGGRTDEARRNLKRALRLEPAGAWALAWLGELSLRQGRPREAAGFLERARRLEKTGWIEALHGETLAQRGASRQARLAFDRALALDPESSLARLGRARLLEIGGRREAALEDLTRALDWEPRSAWLLRWRGSLLLFLERYSEAEADMTRAIEVHPDYAEAYCARGRARGRLGRPHEALSDLDRAVALDGSRADFLVARGLILKDLGLFDRQLTDFAKASALDPNRFGSLGEAACARAVRS